MSAQIERVSTPMYSNFSDPSIMESDADKSYSESTLQQTSQKQLTSNDAAIMQREREITDTAQGIIELAEFSRSYRA